MGLKVLSRQFLIFLQSLDSLESSLRVLRVLRVFPYLIYEWNSRIVSKYYLESIASILFQTKVVGPFWAIDCWRLMSALDDAGTSEKQEPQTEVKDPENADTLLEAEEDEKEDENQKEQETDEPKTENPEDFPVRL